MSRQQITKQMWEDLCKWKREDKIRFLKEWEQGVPLRFALNRRKLTILTKNEGEEDWHTEDGMTITEKDREKYCPDSVLVVNVSKKFKI